MKAAVYDVINTVTQDEMDAGRLQKVFDIAVEINDDIQLPAAFDEPVRVDLIRRAVQAARNNRRQAYGSRAHGGKKRPMAGMKHSVEWWGKGRGVARIMRRTGSSRGAQNPHTLGGRRAHGPKVEKDWSSKLNRGERRLAMHSALAATTSPDLIAGRGHRFAEEIEAFPIVLGSYTEVGEDGASTTEFDAFTTEHATRKLKSILESLGLGADLQRAKEGRKIRAGKGTMRGRVHKQPKSALIVVASKDGLARAARNLPGVDVVAARDLSAEDLAPGGDLGRLTVFTSAAIETLGGSA